MKSIPDFLQPSANDFIAELGEEMEVMIRAVFCGIERIACKENI
jgi:hypothetical protein